MHFIVWLIVSGIAGFLASKLINKTGSGIIMDVILGIVGGFVGGFIVSHVVPSLETETGFTGLVVEIIVACGGAALVIFLWNQFFRKA